VQLTAIYDLICRYHDTYRHPSREELILSVPHALGENPGYRSVQSWPNYSEPGVYIMLNDAKTQVLYVGQAEKLGYRLSTWLRHGTHESRRMRAWEIKPAHVAVVPVQEDHEAASLESFLIRRLHPKENTKGIPDQSENRFRSEQAGESSFWVDGRWYSHQPAEKRGD